MKRPARRRPEIKTAAKIMGRADGTARHVHQFQIACLELERTRRMNELNSATQRVANIHARLEEIEGEMLAHAAAMTPLPGFSSVKMHENAPANLQPKEIAHRPNSSQQPPSVEGKRRTLRY